MFARAKHIKLQEMEVSYPVPPHPLVHGKRHIDSYLSSPIIHMGKEGLPTPKAVMHI